jgi:hypothetical protein
MEDLAFEKPVGSKPQGTPSRSVLWPKPTVVTATVLSTRAREREAAAELNQNVHGRFLRLDRISPYHLGGRLIYAASEISNCGMRIVDISMARAASAGILGGNRFHQRADFVYALRELR